MRAAAERSRGRSRFNLQLLLWVLCWMCFPSALHGQQTNQNQSPQQVFSPTNGYDPSQTAPNTNGQQPRNNTIQMNQGGLNQRNSSSNTRLNDNSGQDTRDRISETANTDAFRYPQDPPTQFQQLIQASTGERIPIFGESLFARVPSTFAPVENAPVTPDYVIGPGDELRVIVWGQVNDQGSFTVDRTGAVTIPSLGTVHVAGLRFSELTEFLRRQFGRVYRNFDLNVNLGQLRSIQVFVVGKARRPGSYTIGSLSTLVNALFASGGVSPQGSLRDIQVRRGDQTVVHFDLYDLLLRGDKSKDVSLQPGDVVFIPPVGPQAALVGSVGTPAVYELRGETTVGQLIELGGGLTSVAAAATARLERVSDRSARSLVNINLGSQLGTPLQDGDVLEIRSIVDRFKDAVTLRGNVANPGRYAWHAGMHVSELIPDKTSLVTRNYWQQRNQLGLLTSDYERLNRPGDRTEGSLSIQSGRAPIPDARPSNSTENQNSSNSGTNANAGNSDSRQTAPDPRTATQQGRGSSVGAALSASDQLFSAKTDVILSAPDIDWSYAVIERQSPVDLSTSLIPFHLGKLVLDGDQSQNIELLAGDVVTIFSTADLRVPSTQQTRFVRLEGEFVASGVYSVHPGETLRQLLARAGGLTPDAYLYASAFTRESTRRVEKQRLSDFADQLEAQSAAAASGASARAVSDRDIAAAQASSEEARTIIARLRRSEPSGRIVLDLKPDSHGLDSIPDLALEDGDRFVVPKVPSNVTVEGQVYNSNAFVFNNGRRVKDYLRQAGGPDRQADQRRTFVLRADGSVFSEQYGNVRRASMFPGDTIVVPPMITRRSVLRTVIDLSTVIGQLGLGIAAINLLR